MKTIASFSRYFPLGALPPGYFLLARFREANIDFALIALIYTALTVVALACLYLNEIRPFHPLALIVTFAVNAAVLVPAPPLLSDDVHRYVWEGHVQNLCCNPYSTPPDHPAFARETLNKQVNHPHLPAVYGPLALLVFRLLAAIAPTVTFFKAALTLAALGLFVVLLSRPSRFGRAFAIFALLPLPLIETAWSGHLEVLGVLFLTLALSRLDRQQGLWAGLALAASIGVKFMPAMLAPLFLLRLKGAERLKFVACLPLCALFYLPFLDAGSLLFYSLQNFARAWEFNGLLYKTFLLFGIPTGLVRLALLALFALVYLALMLSLSRARDIDGLIFLLLFALMLVSPTLYPWYLLWLVPCGAKRFPLTLVTFLSASFYTYNIKEAHIKYGRWEESLPIWIAEYGLTLAAFAVEARRARKRG